MQKKIRTLLLLLPLAAASCSSDEGFGTRPQTGSIRVTVGSGPRIEVQGQSRTGLDEDGSIRWTEGDRIALWAVNSLSEHTLEAQPFEMLHYNDAYDDAKFTSMIGVMPPEETYTYHAVAPVPVATQGLKASFDIPSVQDGTFNGAYDVMVADPIPGGGALTAGDNSERIRLHFTHKVHVLMIRIPSSALGEPIHELALTFPTPVTGRLTVDASDPHAEPELSGTEKTLTLRFAQPLDAGATVYAVIAPVAFADTEAIEIKAAGQNYESTPAYMAGKTFNAGRMTPIVLNVPDRGKMFTYLRFTVAEDGTNTLGEGIRSFTLTAPEGTAFDNGSNVRTVEVDGAGDYFIRFSDFPDNLAGQQIAVSYESDHAILEGETFSMPPLMPEIVNEVVPALRVPNLFYENFDDIPTQNISFDATDSNPDAQMLEAARLAGWSGARFRVDQGTAGLSAFMKKGFLGLSYTPYSGRLDTRPLAELKPGVEVPLAITYRAAGTQNGTAFQFGYTTSTTGPIKGNSNSNPQIENAVTTYQNVEVVSGAGFGADAATFHQYEHKFTVTTAAESPTVRLSWQVSTSQKTQQSYPMYIDEIFVRIDNRK